MSTMEKITLRSILRNQFKSVHSQNSKLHLSFQQRHQLVFQSPTKQQRINADKPLHINRGYGKTVLSEKFIETQLPTYPKCLSGVML